MAFTAVFDASVLEASATRGLLVQLAQMGIFRGRWTEKTVEELENALVTERPDLAGRLDPVRRQMRDTVRDCTVTGYEDLVNAVRPPELGRRHVIAAAIKCGAQVIVTGNPDRFPVGAMDQYGIEAQSADQFVLHLISLNVSVVLGAVQLRAAELTHPPMTSEEYLAALENDGLVEAVPELRRHMHA